MPKTLYHNIEKIYYGSKNMQRIIEAELMDDKLQAEAYAAANFEQAHNLVIAAFDRVFPHVKLQEPILDLGCGPGNISFRFADHFPNCKLIAIDGSAEMIRLANKHKDQKPGLYNQINFIEGILPAAEIPKGPYSAIVSNSLLHHLHQPEVLWNTINQYASSGTKIFIMDLFRPLKKEQAQKIVNKYSADEPEILKQDFYNSLLAAFSIKEIEQQLIDARLSELQIDIISDRHILIFGEKH
ncbi:MAG: class I SAM-dependent methyltransferase [Methylococcaceae bacterium]